MQADVTVSMLKTRVLRALQNRSDDRIKHQIPERLSLMGLLGLGQGDRLPDTTTGWLY
ncbi:MAG: hypothetical protein ACJA1F_002273 [Paracoccaceae bacterium]|jgi:hypothetical protein